MNCLWVMAALGILVLAGRLWYVQVVSFNRYEGFREVQSYRTIREPAIRGKILDRNGEILADNRPHYNVVLYLEELRPLFQKTFQEAKRGKSLSRTARSALAVECQYAVVSNLWHQVRAVVGEPGILDRKEFRRHFLHELYVPMPVAEGLTSEQVARFVEKGAHIAGADLALQSLRVYPHGSLAAHVLGHARRGNPKDTEDFEEFNYHQPDFRGFKGVELDFDDVLRGRHGGKSVLINNLMFRQTEHVLFPSEPGDNLYLTLDSRVQRVTEQALADLGEGTLGAAVVMDVTNGDVLALASMPTYDPNEFVGSLSSSRWEELNDPLLRPLINRATYGIYTPGSIFKIVVGLGCLEDNNLDPTVPYRSLGYYRIDKRPIGDLAGAGMFDFSRALAKSSNPYFIHHGLEAGIDTIVKWGQLFFLGQKTGIFPSQELSGSFPTMEKVRGGWHPGETANLCIGQGAIAVTPIQMAVMMSAIANRGTVFVPRIVARTEPQGLTGGRAAQVFEAGRVRGRLNASRESFDTIHDAMEREVDDLADGTGGAARIPGYRIGGKTGTAETSKRIDGRKIDDTWFVSFAPMEAPRYAVVVLVVDGISGGVSCAPVARKIYRLLKDLPVSREVVRPRPSLLKPNRS